jgi:dihydropteroate synthase
MGGLGELRCGRHVLSFGRTLVMGILNVTPDSFSDGGRFADVGAAVEHGRRLAADGADIIDVGGESSRPGAAPVPFGEELARVRPVVERLSAELGIPVSIDTYKAKVARECLKAGACMVNDISGLSDRKMIRACADYGAPAVLMHMKGTPQNMQASPHYADVVAEIIGFMQERIALAEDLGVGGVIVDPGLGFGKTTAHNLEILRRLGEFGRLGRPLLVGPSRKSFIGDVTGLPVEERLEGTLASVTAAVLNGANIVRVHDVKECRRAVQVADAIRGA